MRALCAIVIMKMSLSAVLAQPQQENRYQGQENRPIKSLSPTEMLGFLTGKGMGFGKTAELNHYPGPKHVLELSARLKLTPIQIALTRAAHDKMLRNAQRLGRDYVEAEKKLEELFSSQYADSLRVEHLVAEAAEIRGRIRLAHLQAHLAMKRILTPTQIKLYDRLRGYGLRRPASTPPSRHSGHQH